MNSPSNELIIVLGMHYSDTCSVMQGLSALGIDCRESMLSSFDGQDARGYCEDIDLNKLSNEIFKALGIEWHSITPISSFEIEGLRRQGFFLRAVELLRSNYLTTSICCFNDPRMSKLIPFWNEVFAYCQIKVSYVFAIRHPLCLAQSLSDLNGLGREQSYLLWFGYVLMSLAASKNNQRVVVDVDLLVQDPIRELTRIVTHFDLRVDQSKLQGFSKESSDHGVKRTSYQLSDLQLDPSCPQFVKELYVELLNVASQKKKLGDLELQNRIDFWSNDLIFMNELLQFANKLLMKRIVDQPPVYKSALYWNETRKNEISELKKIEGIWKALDDETWRVSFRFNGDSYKHISRIRLDPISEQKAIWIKNATITNELGVKVWEWAPNRNLDIHINADFAELEVDNSMIIVPTNENPQWYPHIPMDILQGIDARSVFSFDMVDNQEIISRNIVKAHRAATIHSAKLEEKVTNLHNDIVDSNSFIANLYQFIFEQNEHLINENSGVQKYRYLNLPACSGTKDINVNLPRVAVHIHVHYVELLNELLENASSLPGEPDIYVTTTQPVELIIERVQEIFPKATVRQVENKGKDLGPFIDIIQQFRLDEYDLVLKIHGKKSLNSKNYMNAVRELFGNDILDGDDWRRKLIKPLTSDQQRVKQIYQAFDENVTLGMVGAARFVCSAEDVNEFGYAELCKSLSVCPNILFFGGTMFWIRGRHLRRFRTAGMSQRNFKIEDKDNVENTLEHACERVFGSLVITDSGWVGGIM